MHENNQMNYESNFTRGTSRSETCNCPSCSTGPHALKHNTKSFSYSNSSEDESERIERKEKERIKQKLIREHLRQKSKDQSYEYCLESLEHAGQNLADTEETDGEIIVSDWSEPEPNDDNGEDEIFVGYFEDSEALQEYDETVNSAEDLESNEMWANVEHRGNVVELRGSSIPLSTDFAERVLPLISNQMGPAPSRFRNDDQEQIMRTVANENDNANSNTNNPTHFSIGSIENKVGNEVNKVSTNKNRVEIPGPKPIKFTLFNVNELMRTKLMGEYSMENMNSLGNDMVWWRAYANKAKENLFLVR